MWCLGSRLIFVAVVCSAGIAAPQKTASPGSCAVSALPPQIHGKLKSEFAGWRPKQLSDLDVDDQRIWLEGQGERACPGIAIGHFENAKQASYAFLLVPESEPTRGYRIVVLSNDSSGQSYASKLLDSADGETYSGLVIFKVKPGMFSDVDGTKKIQTKLDGVTVEWIEKGAVLYYWSGDHYLRLPISD